MSKIIVLAGGTSGEREVSLRSGAAVANALMAAGHLVTVEDPADGLENLLPKLEMADVIFPALHGAGGEDGILQKFLESHHIKYVGSDSQASELCFDKARYTRLLHDNDILVPKTLLVNYREFQRSSLAQKPYVLKPNDGGSSIDTFIVRDPDAANHSSIQNAFKQYEQLLLQELIEGVETTVAVLGDEPLPVIEIIPPSGGEFDYENKYNGQTQELCPPKHVSDTLQRKAQRIAQSVHELTGCRDMSRTDIMITKDGQLYVLETNTIPGLTDESLLPKAAATADYNMADLCSNLIDLALARDT